MLPRMRVHETRYPRLAMASVTSDTKATAPVGTETAKGGAEAAKGAAELTIEQLAAEVGMSVRNIRNHHSRGLLPAPEVRARVGYYSGDHVARLRLIQDLQADGFNLAAIERLLSGSDGLAARLLGPRQALTTPLQPEQPGPITPAPPDQGLRG